MNRHDQNYEKTVIPTKTFAGQSIKVYNDNQSTASTLHIFYVIEKPLFAADPNKIASLDSLERIMYRSCQGRRCTTESLID